MKTSSNTFRYSSNAYTVNANLYTNTGSPDTDVNIALDINDTEEIVYEGKLNDLLLRGHVIYTDRYAQVDKMFNQHFGYFELMFALNKKETDKQVGLVEIDENNKFQHIFVVTDIKVLDRKASVIKYQIEFVSMAWFNCIANLQYSNYGSVSESILDILKNCIVQQGLAIDDRTFGMVKTIVKSNYITQLNDNLFSSTNYLLHKLYYNPIRDDSIKFIVFDWFDSKYRLIDLKNKDTFVGTFTTMLSFFKSNNEMLIQQEPTNFGSLQNAMPKTEAYKNAFDKDLFSYDYSRDMFSHNYAFQEETINYFNNKIDNSMYFQKFQKMFNVPNTKFIDHGSYWNNDQATYNAAVQMLNENSSLIMNITGEIRRQPGSFTTVAIDRTVASMETENKKEFEKRKQMYKTYEGVWIASKVRNIIRPSASTFRQQLVLFRNFIPMYKSVAEIEQTAGSGAEQQPQSTNGGNSSRFSKKTQDRYSYWR